MAGETNGIIVTNLLGYTNSMSLSMKRDSRVPDYLTKEWAAADADGNLRNYIGRQMQQLTDNNYDMSASKAFFDAVSGKGTDGFRTRFNVGGEDGTSFNERELLAIGQTMWQLADMQSNGKITTEQYADYMRALTSGDALEDIRAGGGDKAFDLFERIAKEQGNSERPYMNENDLAVAPRPIINGRDDYLQHMQELHCSQDCEDPRKWLALEDGITPIVAFLDETYADGKGPLSQEEYDAAKSAMRSYHEGMTAYTDRAMMNNTLYYAMMDAVATGDKDMIKKVMSPEGITALTTDIETDEKGIDILRELETMTATGSVSDKKNPDPDKNTPVADRSVDSRTVPAQGDAVDMDRDQVRSLVDDTVMRYFGNKLDNGVDFAEYQVQLEEYDKIRDDPAAAAKFRSDNPEFAKADSFMAKADNLEQLLNFKLAEVYVGEDGEYGIRPGETAKLLEDYDFSNNDDIKKFKEDHAELAEFAKTFDDGEMSYQSMISSMMAGTKPAYYDITPGFTDAFQTSMEAAEGDGKKVLASKYDAEFNETDIANIAHLGSVSPDDQFNALKEMAITVTRGGAESTYGSGKERQENLKADIAKQFGLGDSEADQARAGQMAQYVQDMVNRAFDPSYGSSWLVNADINDFDTMLQDKYGDKAESFVGLQQAFSSDQLATAMKVMTYESADALGKALGEDETGGRSAEQIYDAAAKALAGHSAEDLSAASAEAFSGKAAGSKTFYEIDAHQNLEAYVATAAAKAEDGEKTGFEDTKVMERVEERETGSDFEYDG